MRKLLKWLLAVVVLFDSLRRKPRESRPHADTRLVEPAEPHPRAELVVAGLLLATGAAGALAVLAYGLDWSTQAFGGALTGALMLLAAAFIVAAKTFVPDEHVDEEYPPEAHPEEQGDVTRIVRQSASGITRKRLLGCAAALAGGGLGAALIVPAVSLGPVFDTSRLNASPWRRGIGLLDDKSRPWLADDIAEDGTFYTALPEGADPKAIGAPIVLVKIDPAQLRLPRGREDWAPEGILAYSKICTHAGCSITLYRNPSFDETEPGRALVCPCHYSTFDPGAGGEVLFGPAGRPLPQLPLTIAPDRRLLAAGGLSGPPGPAWWGVRNS